MIAKGKKRTAALIPAVAYIRMSSDKQDKSPDQQRAICKELATKYGCEIIREYFDKGISGAETTKRHQFVKMIGDAKDRGDFRVILCWDQDRFGRFDSIEAGEWISPLRRADVRLITFAQGEIDWTAFAGRMIYSMQQEGKNQYLLDLSRNTLRGRLAAARRGERTGQSPFGYLRVILDETGKEVNRIKRGQQFSAPDTWTTKYEPDPDDAEVVRWMFDTFANTDCSMLSIVKELNDRNVPPPGARRSRRKTRHYWAHSVVKKILQNAVYMGTLEFGRQRCGKFHTLDDAGDIVPRSNKRWMVSNPVVNIPGAITALVDAATFKRVQAKIENRKLHGRRPSCNSFVLSGILRCGHCGGALVGHSVKRAPGNGHQYRYYQCGTATLAGKCRRYSIRAELLEDYLVGVLQDEVLNPESIAALRAELERQTSKRAKLSRVDAKQVRIELGVLETKITRGAENMLLADPADIKDMSAVLSTLRIERDRLQAELADGDAGNASTVTVDAAMANVERLRDRFAGANVATRRQVLREVFSEITLWWEKEGKGYRLKRGVVEFCSIDSFSPCGRIAKICRKAVILQRAPGVTPFSVLPDVRASTHASLAPSESARPQAPPTPCMAEYRFLVGASKISKDLFLATREPLS